MRALLAVSADVVAVEQIERVAAECRFRFRAVSAPEAAKEWLMMQSFDIMLVDSRYADSIPTNLLTVAWTHHPLLIGGIFNFQDSIPDAWTASLLGARVFSGPNALSQVKDCLTKLPEQSSLLTSFFGVLVIEDLDAPRDIICAYIESLGHSHVDGASNAKEALELLHADPYIYFCAVTDIQMPQVNGIQLIEQIRRESDPFISALPIIVLTSSPSPENLLACIKAGATGFLAKPPRKKELRTELEKAKRMVFSKQSPRVCPPDDAYLLEKALRKLSI